MFQSRVMGVGIQTTTQSNQSIYGASFDAAYKDWEKKVGIWNAGLEEARKKCPPIDPSIRFIQAPVCQPAKDYVKIHPSPNRPVPQDYVDSSPTPAAPTGSALPLLLGAAYLLLS
jgi:hypothetical protein